MPSSSSSSARDAERKALGDFNARSSFNKELNQLKVSRGEMDDLRRKLKDSERAREKMQREFSERLAAVEQTMRSGANPGAESRLLRLEARVDDALEKLEGKANRASVASACATKSARTIPRPVVAERRSGSSLPLPSQSIIRSPFGKSCAREPAS